MVPRGKIRLKQNFDDFSSPLLSHIHLDLKHNSNFAIVSNRLEIGFDTPPKLDYP